MTEHQDEPRRPNRPHHPDEDSRTDLVLNPGEYAYLQDETKGCIKTYTGPITVNKTPQDRPIRFRTQTMQPIVKSKKNRKKGNKDEHI